MKKEVAQQSVAPEFEPKPYRSAALSAITTVFELIKTVGLVVVIAFLIRQFLVQPFVVDGESMEPNFHHQNYILVDKLSYQLRSPQRGDVIVFHPPTQIRDNFIKRVIGLPGELVEVKGEQISINGQLLKEPYRVAIEPSLLSAQNDLIKLLGPDEYFVLGDNRDHSKDSREIGAVPSANIIGRAWLVLFPVQDVTVLAAPSYPSLQPPAPSAP